MIFITMVKSTIVLPSRTITLAWYLKYHIQIALYMIVVIIQYHGKQCLHSTFGTNVIFSFFIYILL